MVQERIVEDLECASLAEHSFPHKDQHEVDAVQLQELLLCPSLQQTAADAVEEVLHNFFFLHCARVSLPVCGKQRQDCFEAVALEELLLRCLAVLHEDGEHFRAVHLEAGRVRLGCRVQASGEHMSNAGDKVLHDRRLLRKLLCHLWPHVAHVLHHRQRAVNALAVLLLHRVQPLQVFRKVLKAAIVHNGIEENAGGGLLREDGGLCEVDEELNHLERNVCVIVEQHREQRRHAANLHEGRVQAAVGAEDGELLDRLVQLHLALHEHLRLGSVAQPLLRVGCDRLLEAKASLPQALDVQLVDDRRLLQELVELCLIKVKLIKVHLHVRNAFRVDLHRVHAVVLYPHPL
mmetsp:Transcript_4518/g.15893  ORF Transcript_4518/g.15893 Transcript_4518/m.15893 type:complete len:348 (+) Transcript_4518:725-1768(+)